MKENKSAGHSRTIIDYHMLIESFFDEDKPPRFKLMGY